MYSVIYLHSDINRRRSENFYMLIFITGQKLENEWAKVNTITFEIQFMNAILPRHVSA